MKALRFSELDYDYAELMSQRLVRLVQGGWISQKTAEEFRTLEQAMNRGGLLGDTFWASYQKSDDRYKRQLEKIVRALKEIGEPHAAEKYRAVVEELATMGPAVYLTPWEITLSYLDSQYGDFQDVVAFYQSE